MTNTEATGRQTPPRGSRIALALLAATAALTAGAQALSPAPAVALNNQGNQCEDLPPWEATNCEMEGGGGGLGGAGSGGIVGGETIEIHESLSPCQRSPLSCLPSDGRSQHGSDGARPHGPRPGGRPTRAAEGLSGGATPTFDDCRKLRSGELTLRPDKRIDRLADAMAILDRRAENLSLQMEYLQSEQTRLERLSAPTALIDGWTEAIKSLKRERFALRQRSFEIRQKYSDLQNKWDAEAATLRWRCKSLYWPAFDD